MNNLVFVVLAVGIALGFSTEASVDEVCLKLRTAKFTVYDNVLLFSAEDCVNRDITHRFRYEMGSEI